MMKYQVSLHGAPAHNPEAVNFITFTMQAEDPIELLGMIHMKYANITLLKFNLMLG